jgi:hypothetical protein
MFVGKNLIFSPNSELRDTKSRRRKKRDKGNKNKIKKRKEKGKKA